MRFWVYDPKSKKVLGPHLTMTLQKVPDFGPDTKVAPADAKSASDWKRAGDVPELQSLFAAPEPEKPAPKPGEAPKP
ncbi:MAG: hypothetical protein KGM24_00485 [Elusimicrobia bacterium]|nr:hypothetical protein [Elusimicrobiota bacterium]